MIVNANYKLAAGHDNEAGLVSIEGYTPTGGTAFVSVNAYSRFDPGDFKIRGDGTVMASGFPSMAWVLDHVTRVQEQYLRDTYCAGGYSGKVTLRTDTEEESTYANYNAVLVLPKHEDSERLGNVFRNYRLLFTRLEAL